MDYKKGALINILILIVLFISSLLLKYIPETGKETIIKEDSKSIIDINVADIAAIAIINDGERFGLLHNEGHITIEPMSDRGIFSQKKLQSALYRFSKLSSQSRITGETENLESYGLKNPRALVTIIKRNGNKIHISLGNQNSINQGYYLKKNDTEEIYLISEEDGKLLLSTPNDFIDSALLPSISMENLNLIESIEFKNNGRNFQIKNNGNFIFVMTSPVKNSVDFEFVLSEIIFPLLSLKTSQIPYSTVKLPDTPDLSINIKIGEKVYDLSFYLQKDGSCFITGSNNPGIFKVDDFISFIKLDYLDLLAGSVYHGNISEIKSISVQDKMSGTDYNIELSGESVNIEGKINGLPVTHSEIMDFSDILFHTGISKKLDTPKYLAENDSKTMSIQIYKKNGSMDLLDFVLSDNSKGEQIIFINKEAYFVTYTKVVLDIQNVLANLTE